jgi:hypothetical protein
MHSMFTVNNGGEGVSTLTTIQGLIIIFARMLTYSQTKTFQHINNAS